VSGAARDGDRPDLVDQRLQKGGRGRHEREVSRVGDQDQLLLWRRHAIEVGDGVGRGGQEVVASLDDEEGRPDPAGGRRQIGLDLIGHGLIDAEPEAVLFG